MGYPPPQPTRGLGERRGLPQRGLGRAPGKNDFSAFCNVCFCYVCCYLISSNASVRMYNTIQYSFNEINDKYALIYLKVYESVSNCFI